MPDSEYTESPRIWLIDSERAPLAESRDVFEPWTEIAYFGPGDDSMNWEEPPDAIFLSAEIRGGAGGDFFAELRRAAGQTPVLAVARLRSLTQALSFFRAGATDYLSLPLDAEEVRERLEDALRKAANLALSAMTVEIEPLEPEAVPGETAPPAAGNDDDEAEIVLVPVDEGDGALQASVDALPAPEAKTPDGTKDDEGEAEPVDGLPIPTLWEELPCGLLVFDSIGNLVFSNSLGLELFGRQSLGELQDALENRLSSFAAHGINQKPLADNQWPQAQAKKTRTARSAVISLEKPDRRRVWLRIDCLPHLADGKINRMCMTLVNLTGELPPLTLPVEASTPPREKGKKRGKKRR